MNNQQANNRNMDNLVVAFDSLFNIGDLVLVDNYQRGFIIDKTRNDNGQVEVTVKYVVVNNVEYNISLHRCLVISMTHSTHTRSGSIRNNWLVNQSTTGTPTTNTTQDLEITTPQQNTEETVTHRENNSNSNTQEEITDSSIIDEFKNALMQSCFPNKTNNTSSNFDNNLKEDHPLYCFLKKYEHMDKGWLRIVLQESINLNEISSKSHLNDQETMVMTLMNSLLTGSYSIHRKLSGHVSLVCHALDITRQTRKRNFSLLLENNFVFKKPVSTRKRKKYFQ